VWWPPPRTCGVDVVAERMKKRIAIIGAGLCGSILSARLRNHFQVTIIEQGRKRRPLYGDIRCPRGEIESSINRAEGLGGTTAYWHNALIELARNDLERAGIAPDSFDEYYSRAWAFFLTGAEKAACDAIRDLNCERVNSDSFSLAHMVVPYARANAWELANRRFPGDAIEVVFGTAERIVPREGSLSGHVIVRGRDGLRRVEADHFLMCAGGLSTPVLLSASLGRDEGFCGGYHDHPMAYVAKVRLKPDSPLKTASCTSTVAGDVRSGFVCETGGVKTVFYLRPAMDLGLKSITGPARYLLSDLRNAPFSASRILQLLTNPDALREAVLFKTKAGFRGDYYSLLMLGEQTPDASRGISLGRGQTPALNWHVTTVEETAYRGGFERFLSAFSSEILETNVIPLDRWEYRTAAHHSGTACGLLGERECRGLPYFAVRGLSDTFVCDASVLGSGGIANSGLTLVALGHRLADLMISHL